MLSNHIGRRNFGLQTLTEEGEGAKRDSVTMDSLKDMINTLKTLPPITSKEDGRQHGHRRQSSASSLSINADDRQRRRRAESISEEISREAMLAETREKLMGTFKKKKEGGENERSEEFIRRRYSDASTFDKRPSLQLPSLSENVEAPVNGRSGKRIVFNKPLNLSLDEKKPSSRRSSRNFDNDWRASSGPVVPPFSPRTQSRSFNLVPFTPTRVNFARDDANPHQRRPLFVAHLPFSALTPLFRSRQLVRGTLRVNKRNRSDAYVFCEELDADIYICGSRDRNRALEGDVVAVRLVDVDKVLREKKEKEEAKLVRNGGQLRVRLPDEEDENEIIFGGDDDVDKVKPKFCGLVVAILERAQNQVFSGNLTLMRPNNKHNEDGRPDRKEAPRIVWFKATDKRVPLIAIPIDQAPANFVEKSEDYAMRLFVGSIKRWPITSLHPFGTLGNELGSVFDLLPQTQAILADNKVTDTEFPDDVQQCIPPSPCQFSEKGRRDLGHLRVFTIDPAGSDVLEDALSIETLGDEIYEVGVHVSDVTYFIKPHSPLDKDARARGVQVDLVHHSVPMLPKRLTEEITNLSPGERRQGSLRIEETGTFGDLEDQSAARLTFDDAEKALNGHLDCVSDKRTCAAIEQDIHLLNTIAIQLHESRFDNGAMSQRRDELAFEFDDKEEVTGLSMRKKTNAVKLVKEFLLLANTCVAQKISSHLPEQALLRRHPPPVERKIRELQIYAQQYLGVQLDITNAGTLEKSIESIQNPQLRKVVSVIVLKTMATPKYFCTGTLDILKYSHYSLNTPLFTHFTAPSRRFSDIIVHRQLLSALSDDEDNFYLDRDNVQKLCQHCNVKKDAALYAMEQSRLLFLSLLLKRKSNQREAIVVSVSDQYFDVMILDLNMEKRVHLPNLPVWRSSYQEKERALTMYWRKGVDTSTGKQSRWSLSDDEDEDEMDEDALFEEMQNNSAEEPDEGVEESRKETKAEKPLDEVIVDDLQVHQQQQEAAVAPTASVSSSRRPEASRSSNRRASIVRARLSDSTAYNTDQGFQTIKALDKIRVVVNVEMVRTPPLVRILAVNPFA
ncbi:hypothetical protein DFQ28_005394 [Apophysomyces sp. BC1034]|nr:hypothetical protein DFQ30_010990 [Apophysomyces sp. BC1015]KAG0193390.1 hypothetical protein DFQ28_005394 [Apophysomyces sp. BC1034]